MSDMELEWLHRVSLDGYQLEHSPIQTPEICLAAVKQNGVALKFVRNQTPELCMMAVEQYGFMLCYVRDLRYVLQLFNIRILHWAL